MVTTNNQTSEKTISLKAYVIFVTWSNDDQAFLAAIPSLQGCIAHGDSPQEAVENVLEVGQEWLQIAKENHWPIPDPDSDPTPGNNSYAMAA